MALPTMKLMCLGDSITHGTNDVYASPNQSTGAGYRRLLWQLITRAGMNINMVGSQTNNPAAPGLIDIDHEGHPSYSIAGDINGNGIQIYSNLQTWIQSAKPDAVLFHIGTNDIGQNIDLPNAGNRIKLCIQRIMQYQPGCRVVLAKVIPVVGQEARTATLNNQIPTVVSQLQAAPYNYNVRMCDQFTTMPSPLPGGDTVHPNNVGYDIMARTWFPFLQDVYDEFLEPFPSHPKPTATPGNNKITLNWPDSTHSPNRYNIYRSTTAGQLGSLISGSAFTSSPWTDVVIEQFNTPVPEGQMINSAGTGIGDYSNWIAYATGTNDTQANNGGTNSGYDNSIISVGPSADTSVGGNVMKMRHRVNSSGRALGAAPIPKIPGRTTWPYNIRTYGRNESRMRVVNPVQGYKTAWLWWSANYDRPAGDPLRKFWPSEGETDFPEGNLDGNIAVFMHWMGATNGGQQDGPGSGSYSYSSWHTLVEEWTPGQWKFWIDGNLIMTSTGSHVPNIPMRWVMQTETVLSNSGRPIAGQECTTEIDYLIMSEYTP